MKQLIRRTKPQAFQKKKKTPHIPKTIQKCGQSRNRGQLIVPAIPTFVQRESDGRRSLRDSPNLGQPTGKDEAIIP